MVPVQVPSRRELDQACSKYHAPEFRKDLQVGGTQLAKTFNLESYLCNSEFSGPGWAGEKFKVLEPNGYGMHVVACMYAIRSWAMIS